MRIHMILGTALLEAIRSHHTAPHCNTLQHRGCGNRAHPCHFQNDTSCSGTPATHCNTLQHAATHCNTLQHRGCGNRAHPCHFRQDAFRSSTPATHCNTLQQTATHYNTLQHRECANRAHPCHFRHDTSCSGTRVPHAHIAGALASAAPACPPLALPATTLYFSTMSHPSCHVEGLDVGVLCVCVCVCVVCLDVG